MPARARARVCVEPPLTDVAARQMLTCDVLVYKRVVCPNGSLHWHFDRCVQRVCARVCAGVPLSNVARRSPEFNKMVGAQAAKVDGA